VREIYATELVRSADNEELVFTVRGRSFLRYMVRKMVGTLLDVGRGRLTPDDIDRLFEIRDRSKSGPTAPPQGLCMISVEHDEPYRIA
jgi:tRNA pseudouridine38-40 synthase